MSRIPKHTPIPLREPGDGDLDPKPEVKVEHEFEQVGYIRICKLCKQQTRTREFDGATIAMDDKGRDHPQADIKFCRPSDYRRGKKR